MGKAVVTFQQTSKVPGKVGTNGTPYPDIIESLSIQLECEDTEDAISETYIKASEIAFRAKINRSKSIKNRNSGTKAPVGKSVGMKDWDNQF
jgi:hypothetical protein